MSRPLIVVVAVSCLLVTSSARADELVGEWVHRLDKGESRIVLKSDGSYSYDGQTGSWKQTGSKLVLAPSDMPGEKLEYSVALAGDKLTLSGGELAKPMEFAREGKKPEAKPETKAEPEKKAEANVPDEAPSRVKQGAPKEVKKTTIKFKSKTRELATEVGKVVLPESWTFQQTETKTSGLQIIACNPGYKAGDTAKHQVIFIVNPLKPSEIAKGFKDRVEAGAKIVDEQVFTGWKRDKLEVLEGTNGLIARLDYSGEINNANVRGAKAKGFCAVTQRKNYDVAVVVVSLESAAGELDDDCLAVLDSIELKIKDRETETEKKIAGTWLVPSKTGNTWEQYTFGADGSYKWHYESSYTGQFKDSGGTQTGYWGTASGEDETGRFEIRGGIIYFISREKGEQGVTFEPGTDAKGKSFIKIGSRKFYR